MRQRTAYKLPGRLARAAFTVVVSGASPFVFAATTLVAQHSGKCLGVEGAASGSGVVVEQQTCNGASNQSWSLNDTGAGQYELVAGNSGKCLEVRDNRTDDTAPIQQGLCTRKPAQQWRLRSKGASVYEIVNFPSSRCLDVIGGEHATADGIDTELWHCTGLQNEAWTVTVPPPAPIQSLIVAKHSGKCLDVTGGPGGTQNGARIEQWTCNATTNQKWTLTDAGGGLAQLVAQNSGKCIEALTSTNEAEIRQTDCANDPGQLWSLQPASLTGEYKIVHAASGRCLDVIGGPSGIANGAFTELWDCTGTTNQTWTIRGIASGTRDPLKAPFAVDSIWNTPIGSAAVYVPSGLSDRPGNAWDPAHPEALGYPNPVDVTWAPMPGIDSERIVLKPTAPPLPIYKGLDWDGDNGNRCVAVGGATPTTLLYTVPVPANYLLPSNNGNNSATFLMPDGYTLVQTQPFVRCLASNGQPENHGVGLVKFDPPGDLYTDGLMGSHGGSKLSAFGGTIRKGELRPGMQGPRHVLKVAVYSDEAFFRCDPDPTDDNPADTTDDDRADRVRCFRWPALVADSNSLDRYGRANNNTNTAMKMGALLAIRPTVDLATLGLQTDPGRQIAWTLQNYGAYVVDSTGGPGFLLDVEDGGPSNDLVSNGVESKRKEFRDDYGYEILSRMNAVEKPSDPNYPNDPQTQHARWRDDMRLIVRELYVVNNNSATSVGGGGTPRQPLVPGIVHPPIQ